MTTQPAPGTEETIGVAGFLIDSTLLGCAVDSAGQDAVIDCLLLAQRTPPETGAFSTWMQAYCSVLTQLGWVITFNSQTSTELTPPHLLGPRRAVPWPVISAQLRPDAGAVGLDALVTAAGRLTDAAAQSWQQATIFGGSALAVFATATAAGENYQLTLYGSWLTYAVTPPVTVPGYPDQEVPTSGSTLVCQTTVLLINTGTLASDRTRLDQLVANARSKIIPLYP